MRANSCFAVQICSGIRPQLRIPIVCLSVRSFRQDNAVLLSATTDDGSADLTVRNDGDHAIRIHASARPSDWSAEFGTLRTIVGVGETAVITLALSEEEAAKTGIVVLFLDCWESYMDDYASRPQDEQGGDLTSLSGKITILGVQTY